MVFIEFVFHIVAIYFLHVFFIIYFGGINNMENCEGTKSWKIKTKWKSLGSFPYFILNVPSIFLKVISRVHDFSQWMQSVGSLIQL